MTASAIPAASGAGAAAGPDNVRQLDDVMLAMDVVDTLRHRERIVDEELDETGRRDLMVSRLKEIYSAQGIEVPDRILRDGVSALAEQRFTYKPPPETFQVRLARLYVSRRRWLPPAASLAACVAALIVGWQVFWAIPQANEWRGMLPEIARLLAEGQNLAVEPETDRVLADIAAEGQRAVANDDRGAARAQLALLREMNNRLAEEYDIRIVSRPGENTGFWRASAERPDARNYYIVVEPVAAGGRILKVPILSTETQKTSVVSKWAQRVSKDTFDRLFEEKTSTGLITDDVLGRKALGELKPRFAAPTPGGAIVDWDQE